MESRSSWNSSPGRGTKFSYCIFSRLQSAIQTMKSGMISTESQQRHQQEVAPMTDSGSLARARDRQSLRAASDRSGDEVSRFQILRKNLTPEFDTTGVDGRLVADECQGDTRLRSRDVCSGGEAEKGTLKRQEAFRQNFQDIRLSRRLTELRPGRYTDTEHKVPSQERGQRVREQRRWGKPARKPVT